MFFMKPFPGSGADNHATMPADERGTRSQPSDNESSDSDKVRWMWLADFALSRAPTEQTVAETEALARKEQEAIKRRIRRTAERVKGQSKSTQ